MNLVMRGISSHNIHSRNADTLEDDWPQTDEYWNIEDPLYLDAVVSNPPYSQKWSPQYKEWDPRYAGYGIAPQSKADYAFLLRDLYHIKPDGIITIVLPHGVLFRWGEEYEIRKNLIEKNNIDTIIGLPSNIFFGTWIPTIIIVLKKRKPDTNIQIIDASKFYIKDGKNNKLRACDIKRIVDIIMARKDKEKFSRIVSRDEIVENDYNLNIPRYVDSSETPEQRDIYATMFGGIPTQELEHYDHYFELFPGLKEQLFDKNNQKYFSAKTENITEELKNHPAVLAYKENFEKTFAPFRQILKTELIDSYQKIDINAMESKLWDQLFNLLDTIKLVDNYDAYQILSDNWTNISGNLEILKAEGIDSCKKIDENLVRKKDEKSKELIEVADGYRGRIFDFEVIKKYKLQEETANIEKQKEALTAITAQYEELFSNLTEDQQEALWDAISEESFVNKEIAAKAKEIKKENKNLNFDQESPKFIVLKVNALIEQEKSLNKFIKELEAQLLTKIMKSSSLFLCRICSFDFIPLPTMAIANWKFWEVISITPPMPSQIRFPSQRIVFIIDECHRNTFGSMMATIKETFPDAMFFGFTGTPIFDEDAKNWDFTSSIFGDELHRYSIADGIRDGNVLGFDPYQCLAYSDTKLKKEIALYIAGAKGVDTMDEKQQTWISTEISSKKKSSRISWTDERP